MKKWNLIIDVALCEGCHNCALAAKDEHVGNEFPGYSAPHAKLGESVIKIHRKVRGSGSMIDAAYLPSMCNHCDAAPCVQAGEGAVRKRSDGVVIIDPVKAKGRRDLVGSCPYGAIVWNEEQQLPQTWIFDAHLLDRGWTSPRCAHVCPTHAIESVKESDEEMAHRAQRERLETLRPELKLRPRVYYRNLHRYSRCFIGGAVCAVIDGRMECVEDARVCLFQGGKAIEQGTTDVFGEFRFDGLPDHSGEYAIDVEHPAHGHATARVQLAGTSINVGEIELTRMAPAAT